MQKALSSPWKFKFSRGKSSLSTLFPQICIIKRKTPLSTNFPHSLHLSTHFSHYWRSNSTQLTRTFNEIIQIWNKIFPQTKATLNPTQFHYNWGDTTFLYSVQQSANKCSKAFLLLKTPKTRKLVDKISCESSKVTPKPLIKHMDC